MRHGRRGARAITAMCVLALTATGCGGSSDKNGAALPKNGEATATDSQVAINHDGIAATGELKTSGALEGTWHWAEGQEIKCAPPSIGLTMDGSSDTLGYVMVDLDGTVSFGTGKISHGPFGGTGGKVDVQANTGSGNYLGEGTMTLDNVTVVGDDQTTSLVLNGSLDFTC